MIILKKVGAWLARIGGGLVMIWLILSWVEFQTEKRVAAARLEGKAKCEAEYAKNEVKKTEREKALQNEKFNKKAIIWSKRAIDDDTVQRLYDNGIL